MLLWNRLVRTFVPVLVVAACASAQDPPPSSSASAKADPAAEVKPASEPPEPPGGKRVLGVLPNYRTASESEKSTPISVKRKFIIASKDSFDYPLVLLAGAFAGLGQLTNENPSFGQGLKGYGHRLIAAYGDQAIGNMMTEGIFPSFLHEDPRYFRRGTGSKTSRTWYALSRVLITRTDAGTTRFNFSEVVGNATGVAISNAYYPEGRNFTDNVQKLGTQIGTDAISQVLKEFWPDIKEKFFKRHKADTLGQSSH